MTAVKPVVFFHVMKCGGTSVRAGLAKGIGGERDGGGIFELDGRAAKGAAGGGHSENWQFRDQLLSYEVLAGRSDLVMGHFRYRDRYTELAPHAAFVTVLRDPVDRFVSLYRYRRYKEGVDVPVAGSLEDFLDTPRWQKEGHAYVSLFCGNDDLDPRSDAAVDAATANLEHFAVVGFLDQLDEFAAAVGRVVDRTVEIPRLNDSPAPREEREREFDEPLLARIHEVCAPDQAFYDAARARHLAESAGGRRGS